MRSTTGGLIASEAAFRPVNPGLAGSDETRNKTHFLLPPRLAFTPSGIIGVAPLHIAATIMSKAQHQPALPRIFTVRGKKVVLDSDLAKLYAVRTFRLNEAVKRNATRFPEDFSFYLR